MEEIKRAIRTHQFFIDRYFSSKGFEYFKDYHENKIQILTKILYEKLQTN